MRRIGLAVVLAVSLLAAPLAAGAQPAGKQPRIALVFGNAPESELQGPNPRAAYARVFLDKMRELGWVDGKNITIERRSVEGQPNRLPHLAKELVGLHVDVIVLASSAEPILAVKQVVGSIPLVVLGADASRLVRDGLAESIARPKGTVTGFSYLPGPEVLGKRIQLLTETLPKASRVAYVTQALPIPQAAAAAAHSLSLILLPIEVATPERFETAFATIQRERVAAIFVGDGWFFQGNIHWFVNFAAQQRLPAFYRDRLFVEQGGLLSYGPDWADLFRRAPIYVDKILRGTKPGDLPIEQPTKFELVINLKTARALGLTIPATILLQADQVIE
jgi:putative tryptophan/tyrosine transport system substrate-binding protein